MEDESIENILVRKRDMTAKDWGIDALVAAGAFVFGCVQLMLSASLILPDEAFRRLLGIESVTPAASSFFALALTTLPLAVRRRAPWVAFAFTFIAFLGLQSVFRGISLAIAGPMIALATIAFECSRAETAVALGASLAGLAVAPVGGSSAAMGFWSYVQDAGFMIAAAVGGYALRTRKDYVQAAEQRAEQAERTREEVAARRVEQERVRIAREVHDITAHSLSAVSVQTAAAERLIDRDPKAAKEAVRLARSTAKSALDEIRGMIGVLRSGDSPAETAPTEGTARLGDLIAFLRDAGIDASLDDASYHRETVPAYIDIALFGIAREATTNIVRHARAAHARIVLLSGDGQVSMRVENDAAGDAGASASFPDVPAPAGEGASGEGASAAAPGEGGGHGIIGMRERARLLGGVLNAGSRADGGFVVSVSIPFGEHGDNRGAE